MLIAKPLKLAAPMTTAVWPVTRRLLCLASLAAAAGATLAQGKAAAPALEPFDNKMFDRPTTIDNPWLPMKPGMRYVYEGHTVEDGGKRLPHRIEIHITDLTKLIDGVRVLV